VILQIGFPVFLGLFDVFALRGFIASCENEDGFTVMLAEIHPIPRPKEQTQLVQTSVDGFAVAKLTVLHPGNPRQNTRLHFPVQRVQPFEIGAIVRATSENEDFVLAWLQQGSVLV
jgi:hypothetical protein